MLKKSFFVLLICAIFGCQQDDGSDSIENQIKGKWNWSESIGGNDGVTIHSPEIDSYTRQFNFINNQVILTINQTDTIQNTSYKIQKEESILYQENYDVLTINYKFYDSQTNDLIILPMRYLIIHLDNSSLRIVEDVYDGYNHSYKR